MDEKLSQLRRKLKDERESADKRLVKKMRLEKWTTFRKIGNEKQYKFNEEVQDKLDSASHSERKCEPHTRNAYVSEPHTRNVNVSEPHSRNVNVSEPRTRNANVSEPHTRNVNVAVPGRNQTFRCVFRSHCCVQNAVAQNFR